MVHNEISFWRAAGFAFVGTDGEIWHFVRDGFAYLYIDNGFSVVPYPAASYDCMYSRAQYERGADHLRAADLLADVRSYYAEMNDVYLAPNQIRAWTLPPDQEC